ncbi:PLP-dependent aminotransferase family protein [Paenibacillus sp. SYP-B3998]|uniref:PLP-dependent aminotransferase family protein n=1 Tax=Paenibacillus sp. SYP-B3998 TaxID=2678564 RepID=A0A6G3ZTC3_9BACL|nr:PLP-dependent aminotransferase family protein [Paenibacillus sp. SYP-B3998]NEW04954.1 PLP-dependent aminotransferase family protein [Paenibacillus sp. SYP-B3998]
MLLTVDRTKEQTLTTQVYEQLREAIWSKVLVEGMKLPSSRELASQCGVSRNIIMEAYDQLLVEGYLEVRPRSGTFVAEGASLRLRSSPEHPNDPEVLSTIKASRSLIDFHASRPATDYFPRHLWGRLAKETCYESPDHLFGYIEPEGALALRSTLASYLRQVRGVRCQPNQILITSGATQALYLITKLLTDTQSYIAVEDPAASEMRAIFTYAGAEVRPIQVDDKGILPDRLSRSDRPSFVFVTPSHQFPLGGTLPIQRRIQLIEYARAMNCYIVEDDYDSEFTYDGVPVHSMQGLDPEKVIYVGTFSKILSPSLRIGYIVLPSSLLATFQKNKWYLDRHTSALEQLIMARFIEKGHLERHIRRMRKVYRKRREVLIKSLTEHFGAVEILGHAAGMHLVVRFEGLTFDDTLVQQFKDHDLLVYPVEQFALTKGSYTNSVVLGYGGLTVERIKEGILRMKMVMGNYLIS